MKITITRKDWKRGLCYFYPCDCLLSRAFYRKTGQEVVVWPGEVTMESRLLRYSTRKHEKRLQAAHRDPSLLPITISLR